MKNKNGKIKEIKLFNVMFPVWLLFIFPITWLLVIPVNFIIDSFVLLLGMFLLQVDDKLSFYKKTVLWVFLFGFAADILGGIVLLITQFVEDNAFFYEYLTAPIAQNPFDNVYSLLYTCLAVVISGILIYVFNRFVSFRKISDKKVKRVISLLLAFFTAPYLFLLPTSSIYGGQTESFTNHIVWSDYIQAEVYLADAPEDNITEVESGEHYDYVLVSSFRDGINTAKKERRELPENWKYKVVFKKQGAEEKKLEPILIYEVGGNFYFEWNGRCYVINESCREEMKQEVYEHLNPPEPDIEVIE